MKDEGIDLGTREEKSKAKTDGLSHKLCAGLEVCVQCFSHPVKEPGFLHNV